jgi:molecular chaperone DnaK
MPQVEVTFDIDANGIVNVSAKDKATNKEQQIRIQASGGLNQDEIERMVREAAENAEEDKKRKAIIEAKTEKSLKEHGEHLEAGDRQAIEAALADLKGSLDSEDPDVIKAKTETLQQASMKLGEAMYKASQAQGGGDAGPTGGADAGGARRPDDGVVDAEFEEVDDSKKRSA